MVGNTGIFIGRLTKQPELKTTQSGISVLSFSMAVDKPYNKEHDHPEAVFIPCTAWRKTAEFISKYFTKGSKIAIQGHLDMDNYTDKDGNKRQQLFVVVDEAGFVESKTAQNATDNEPTQNAADVTVEEEEEEEEEEESDELPF